MEIMIMNKWSQILRIIINAANTCVSVSLIEQNLNIENTSRFVATEIFFHCRQVFLWKLLQIPNQNLFSWRHSPCHSDSGNYLIFSSNLLRVFAVWKSSSYLMSCFMHLCLYNISPNAWITWNLTFSNFCIWSNSAETAASGKPLPINYTLDLFLFHLIIHW